MRAAFYTPYLNSLGGGERYLLTLAHALKERGWQISLLWDNPQITNQIYQKFGFKFDTPDFHPDVFAHLSLAHRLLHLRKFHLLFYLSDGSIPLLSAKTNLLHFQVPFQKVNGHSLTNRLKLLKIHHIVCNSKFTKKFIDREFPADSQVIYPPVDTHLFHPGAKKNFILYVGRFSQLLQAKNHHLLVQEFQTLINQANLQNWRLILAGGTEVGTGNLIKRLKTQSQNYPIDILPNPSLKTLIKLYSQAKIFWSASGYGIDPHKHPQKCEHFGITVVEAMASGAIPIVVHQGGHPEIVEHRKSGFLWKDPKSLRSYTLNLTNDKTSLKKLSQAAQQRALAFSTKKFIGSYLNLLSTK